MDVEDVYRLFRQFRADQTEETARLRQELYDTKAQVAGLKLELAESKEEIEGLKRTQVCGGPSTSTVTNPSREVRDDSSTNTVTNPSRGVRDDSSTNTVTSPSRGVRDDSCTNTVTNPSRGVRDDSSTNTVTSPCREVRDDSSTNTVTSPSRGVRDDSSTDTVTSPCREVRDDSSTNTVTSQSTECRRDSCSTQITALTKRIKDIEGQNKDLRERWRHLTKLQHILNSFVLGCQRHHQFDERVQRLEEQFQSLHNDVAALEISLADSNAEMEKQISKTADKPEALDSLLEWSQSCIEQRVVDIRCFSYSRMAVLEDKAGVKNGPAFTIGRKNNGNFEEQVKQQHATCDQVTPVQAKCSYVMMTANLLSNTTYYLHAEGQHNTVEVVAISARRIRCTAFLDDKLSWEFKMMEIKDVKLESATKLSLTFYKRKNFIIVSPDSQVIHDKVKFVLRGRK